MKNIILFIGILIWISSCQQKHKENEQTVAIETSYRPQYHFSPPSNWMNDPNGMVYYEGEYHLFYQYFPDGLVWGPMHWGHAVSPDMINWEHLPIALYPDDLGYIFSGSAVVDYENTSGLGTLEKPAMVAIYTYHDMSAERQGREDYQTQGIAYSIDRGRNWSKYSGNPVIPNPGIRDFRDPKVSWNEDSQKWIMILAVKDHVEIYASDDLKSWEKKSEFGKELGAHGGVWECPDLFSIEDDNGQTRWIMLVSINPGGPNGGSATQYFLGDFDGVEFKPQDSITRWLDYGTDNYAGVTWFGVPETDGRILTIGWMNNWNYANKIPESGSRGSMTVPRELQLVGNDLYSVPVKELETLREGKEQLDETANIVSLSGARLEFNLEIDDSKQFELFNLIFTNQLNERLIVEFSERQVIVNRADAGKNDFSDQFIPIIVTPLESTVKKVQIYMDRTSLEIFINGGERSMTQLIFPTVPFDELTIKDEGSLVSDVIIYTLKSATQEKDVE